MVPVAPVTDCAATLQASDGNFYGFSQNAQTLCQIMPSGASAALPMFSAGLNLGGFYLNGFSTSPSFQATDGFLYGLAYGSVSDGSGPSGVVWKSSLSGESTVLFTFPSVEELPYPGSLLILGKDGNLYGTTSNEAFYNINVFKVTPAGMMTVLYIFGSNPAFVTGLANASDGSLYALRDLVFRWTVSARERRKA
jgi:hypothetical protein